MRLTLIFMIVGTLVEVVETTVREVRQARRRNSPGGEDITREEFIEIVDKVGDRIKPDLRRLVRVLLNG